MSEQVAKSMFDNYRVLDLCDKEGAFAGAVLGGYGADVILVERPGGNPSRWLAPFYHDICDPEMSLFFWYYNTNKRGITLNIETPEGQRILKNLVKTADLLFESFSPGYMDSLGLGYSSLSKINPRLVMVSISPFGQTGPYRDYKSSDLIACAMGGLSWQLGEPNKPPLRYTFEQAYFQASCQAATAAVAALYSREQTGEGQYVDVSMQESITCVIFLLHTQWHVQQTRVRRGGTSVITGLREPMPVVWKCKDGYVGFSQMTAVQGNITKALVNWMEEEGMAEDLAQVNWTKEDSATAASLPRETARHRCEVFQKFFLTKTKKELTERSTRDGSAVYPANTVAELFEDPQLDYRKLWVPVDVPKSGEKILYPTMPVITTELTWQIQRAPLIGEHNLEIYHEELGLSEARIKQLKKSNII